MKKLLKKLKLLKLYLKYRKEIDSHYGYALKEGYVGDETWNWLERTNYWLMSE